MQVNVSYLGKGIVEMGNTEEGVKEPIFLSQNEIAQLRLKSKHGGKMDIV